jgi:hypothetical protein
MKRVLSVVVLFLNLILVAGCAGSYGPGDAEKLNAPSDRDIYLHYSILWDFETAYSRLRNDAPRFADKKCGRGSNFTLDNFWVKPAHVRGLTGVAPTIAASIVCLPQTEVDKNLQKTTRSKAETRCREIGLAVGSKFYRQCVEVGSQ